MSSRRRKMYPHAGDCEKAPDGDGADEMWFELAFC